MRTRVILSVIEILLGLSVGYLAYRMAGAHDPVLGALGIALGLLTAILAGNISDRFLEHTEKAAQEKRAQYLLERIGDRFLTAGDVAAVLKHGGVEIARSDLTRVWLERLWRTSDRYWGVIDTTPEEVTDTNVFQLGMAVLATKARVDQVDVRRIFVVDDDRELEHVARVVAAQQESQVKVRYVTRAAINAHALLRSQLAMLPTTDFVVMDAAVVWLLLLDEKRHIRAGMLHFDERLNAQYAETFRLLWDAAAVLLPIPANRG